jgi:hypothetical protein
MRWILGTPATDASRVGPQFGIVVDRAKRQRRAAAPAPHQLCRQDLLPRAGRVRLEVAAERRHTLVQLAEDDVGAIAAQDLGLSPLDAAHLVGIAQNEFPRLQGVFLGIGSRNAAPFDGRMADAIPESEGLRLGGQRVAVLAPDRRYPWGQLPVRLPSALKHRLEPRTIRRDRDEHDMNVGRPERRFPVLGATVAGVTQSFRARPSPVGTPTRSCRANPAARRGP